MTDIIRVYHLKAVSMDTRTGTALSVALVMFLFLLLSEMCYLLQYEMQNNPFCCIFINQSQVAQCAEPDKSTRESEQISHIYVFVLSLFHI